MTLIERDKRVVWHPFTPQKDMLPPIPIVRGKGTCLYDEAGNEYIDAISSWWVTLHGHGNEYIAKKVYEQALRLEQVIFAGFTHEPAVRLAEQLIEILPVGFSKVFYSDNGSTSTEVALKMAIQYWWNKGVTNRKKILAFHNSYHGDTFGAMSVSDRSVFTLAFQEHLFEVVFIDTPNKENLSEILSVVAANQENIAAFIYEPLVQGAGGIKMYASEFMNPLLETIKKLDIICIADEVMTGFGRTGKLFASEYLDYVPDIICLSKGLTGGTMALGVTACSERIYSAYYTDNKLQTFFHGHSFTANPIACSAALASIDIMLNSTARERIKGIENNHLVFGRFLANKVGLKNEIKQIRILGTILAFEVALGKDEYLNSISALITKKGLEKGIYIRPLGNTIYIMPPYCITDEELNKVYSVIVSILEEI